MGHLTTNLEGEEGKKFFVLILSSLRSDDIGLSKQNNVFDDFSENQPNINLYRDEKQNNLVGLESCLQNVSKLKFYSQLRLRAKFSNFSKNLTVPLSCRGSRCFIIP